MKHVFVAGLILVGFTVSQGASAATQTSQIAASATVTTVCSLTATTLPFSEVALAAVTDGSGTVAVTCTNGGAYNVGLDYGLNAVSTQRNLISGTNILHYGLFSDANYSVPWGNVIGSSTVNGTGSGKEQDLTVYGQIASGQTITTGSYTDTVTVTY